MSLPPISALEALDALARTGSVQGAAEVCALSQSAISHKLRALEERLGFALTEPAGRGVVLSAQGRLYLAAVRPGLNALREAHRGVGEARGPLEIGCASGLAATWLARRLGGFRALCPDVSLGLRSVPLDTPSTGCDLSVIFTARPPEGAVHLLSVPFFPVVEPAYFAAVGAPAPEALEPGQLLHLHTREDWALWLRQTGADGAAAAGGMRFSGLLALYAAVESGLGLCLGDSLTCADALASGRLIRPYPGALRTPYSYWAVPAPGGLTAPAAAFLRWMQAELAQAQSETRDPPRTPPPED